MKRGQQLESFLVIFLLSPKYILLSRLEKPEPLPHQAEPCLLRSKLSKNLNLTKQAIPTSASAAALTARQQWPAINTLHYHARECRL